MPSGDFKHGRAVADREREKRLRMQAETQQALRAFRDSSAELPSFDESERPTSPNIHIHIPEQAKQPINTWHPTTVKGQVMKWVLVGVGIAGGIITALRQAGIIK